MKENPEDKDKDKDEHKDEDEDKDGNKNDDEDVDEYYYDACEQSRSPYGLLYFCEECDFVAHAPCIASSIQLTPASKSSLATFKDGNQDHILTLKPSSFMKCDICVQSHHHSPY